VSARRLFETAVTPCDCSIENATTRAYDGSLPTSVMSVPCRVGQHPRRRRHAVGRQDLTGQIGRGRVRHGVVCVHDVEPMVARQAHEGGGERQQVLGFAEQRIRRCLDPLEREARAHPPAI
jgi:hypothetical protein